jgi:hypothetical protein
MERVVERVEVEPLRATAALAGFAKIGAMLGRGEAGTLLDRGAVVAQSIVARVLLVHRDAERIGEVAQTVLSWHGGPVRRGGVATR